MLLKSTEDPKEFLFVNEKELIRVAINIYCIRN